LIALLPIYLSILLLATNYEYSLLLSLASTEANKTYQIEQMSYHNPGMTEQITRGCVPKLTAGDTLSQPILQVTGIKKVEPAQTKGNAVGPERYRVLLSDGDHIMQGMLATQRNPLVTSGQLIANSVVRLQDYLCNEVQGRKILIILAVDIVQKDAERLGNPTNFESTARPAGPVDVKPVPSAAYGNQQHQQQQQQQQQVSLLDLLFQSVSQYQFTDSLPLDHVFKEAFCIAQELFPL
jgi:hypothetical protein